jgi:hypothetical protein
MRNTHSEEKIKNRLCTKLMIKSMKKSNFYWILAIVLVLFVWTGFSPKAMANDNPDKISQSNVVAQTIFGDEKQVGNGNVRTWVKVDKDQKPLSIGITVTESALSGLPTEDAPPQEGSLKLKLMDGGPNHTFEYELMFPPVGKTAFNHMGFNWNPKGHGPEAFELPHFDVHFYMATTAYRHNVTSDPNEPTKFAKVSNILPPKEFLPEYYELALNTAEPRMGSHYADVRSPQLKPGNFSNIFLIGVHDGNVVFWEPMITLDYLKTKPNFSTKLNVPEAYPIGGYYPTAYSVVYDSKRQEYNISLDDLTYRKASYPGNVYGVN